MTPGPSTSPTLRGDRRYLSVVLGVPEHIQDRVLSWRAAQGLTSSAPPHITVLITETDPRDPLPERIAAELARVCREVGPFRVGFDGAETFLPVSPVAYLRIADGGDHLTRLHRICADLLPSASPFDYHPHLTLAHGLDEEGLHRARRDFASCHLSFRAEQLQIFHGDRTGWRDLGALPLGPAR
ncbi:hypothetical protein BK826_04430 [Rothia kristinae]|uniref:2'-5' RNA ligase n=1 Tax=Rothia kristinae TaxID=37923 RepID=A0A1S2N1H2_9MICC|nr:2'-5' RNA ligase family protein [Rothia kristinae]OIJ36290.1 hypothetical protein BK826_04430 [Rothia kristinae]